MSRIIIGCAAIGLTLNTGLAWAGTDASAVTALVAATMPSQAASGANATEEARRQVMDLLGRARQAMDEGNLETADSLISRAEAMNTDNSPNGLGRLFHLGDTPAKARKDLERLREARQGGARPSQMFSPSPAQPGATDPFAARGEPSMGTVTPLPPQMPADITPPGSMSANQPFPQQAPFGRIDQTGAPPAADHLGSNLVQRINYEEPQRGPSSAVGLAAPGVMGAGLDIPATQRGSRAECDQLLIGARKALALGDVRRATDMVERAKGMGVPYDLHEDSPLKVEAVIRAYTELTSRSAAEQATDAHRRRMADFFLQQAEALLRWNDLEAADRLVGEAERYNANYGPWDTRPETVRGRIADARRAATGGGLEPLPPVDGGRAMQVDYQTPVVGPASTSSPQAKARVLEMVAQARQALAAGDLDRAESLARQAEGLGVRDDEMGPQDDRPWLVLHEVDKIRRRQAPGGVSPASGAALGTPYPGAQALYDPNNDPTRNIPASSQVPAMPAMQPGGQTPPMYDPAVQNAGPAMNLLMQGEAALQAQDMQAAQALFEQALNRQDELDPPSRQRLRERLTLISARAAAQRTTTQPGALIDEQVQSQQLLARQVSSEIARLEGQSRRIQGTDPEQAEALLQQARGIVERSTLEPATRDLLMRRVDRDLEELRAFLQANGPRIALAQRNQAIEAEIDREARHKVEVQEQLATLVNEFNKLMDQQEWEKAELVARKAGELMPDEPVVLQLKQQSRLVRALRNQLNVQEAKENGFVAAFQAVEESAIPFDERKGPMQFRGLREWETLTSIRKMREATGAPRRSEGELQILQKLKTPVSLKFRQAPLSQVMDYLGRVTQVNLYLDEAGLAQEGVSTDTPVTIDLSQEISLRSALNLILEPLHLSFVVKNEVLKITSEQLRDGAVYPVTYHVADLVLPIPNFVPSSRMGLAGAIHDAHAAIGIHGSVGAAAPTAVLASHSPGGKGNAMIDPRILGQFNQLPPGAGMGGGGPPSSGFTQPIGFGAPGSGAGVEPDFDSLIELIRNTIAPTTWSEVGGSGAIESFATNLSLVITQTQEVHEQIAELLEQLRRLQDLQVTIEVKFITLGDNFFEQIGIDFDFEINDNADRPFQVFGKPDTNAASMINRTNYVTPAGVGYGALSPVPTANPPRDIQDRDLSRKAGNSTTVGMSAPGVFSADLDIPFSQSSLAAASGLTTGTLGAGITGGASLGFAILSDLEAFFFINAVQQDIRTNVLQAPKVTLFNGQQAFVSDTAQSPFVISVIPVVGDFAAAQQPVIVVLSEGTFLNVQAVVSSDRRFVRLTVVPFFSQIGDVNTFTFEGSETVTQSQSNTNDDGPDNSGGSSSATVTRSGTTVQLPTFAFTTVTTTVSVPDGGTVLLGGLKQMSEERRENGVPLLNKIPYINRLFNNVATGKSSRSLMMMVTPRIIIQEEEEYLLGVQPSP